MYKPHIIHATETHLDKQISNAELIDPLLYDIYRKDRLFDPGHERGGVLNAIMKGVISSGEITLETDCESTWNKIQIKGSKPLYTCTGCFYRKPNNDAVPIQRLDESLGRLTHTTSLPNIILTGDFNLPDIEWDKEENRTKASPNYSKEINETIINLVNEHNLQQCKNMPTRGNNIFDLVFTTNNNLIENITVEDGISDH